MNYERPAGELSDPENERRLETLTVDIPGIGRFKSVSPYASEEHGRLREEILADFVSEQEKGRFKSGNISGFHFVDSEGRGYDFVNSFNVAIYDADGKEVGPESHHERTGIHEREHGLTLAMYASLEETGELNSFLDAVAGQLEADGTWAGWLKLVLTQWPLNDMGIFNDGLQAAVDLELKKDEVDPRVIMGDVERFLGTGGRYEFLKGFMNELFSVVSEHGHKTLKEKIRRIYLRTGAAGRDLPAEIEE